MADLLQHTLQILRVPPGKLHLLPQVFFRRLGFGIPFIILGSILLGRQKRIQLDRRLGTVFIIKILTDQLALPPLHTVEVGGDQVSADTEPVPVLCGGVVLFLHGQLPLQTVPGGGGSTDQIRATLAHPFLPLPLLIKAVQQGGEAVKPLRLQQAAILKDWKTGKFLRAALLFQHNRCKLVFLDSI